VEPQHHFAKLDAVAVGQLTLSVEVRQLLVVHYYRVGLGKIRDHPLSASVCEPSVLATHRARVQRDVLWRPPGIPPEDQMRLLARHANEADLLVPSIA
jgi:ribosomal protein S27AE